MRQRLPVEIIVDDQDFTQEWLRSGQVLGCVTTLKQALRGCKVVPLGAMHYVAVASPALAARYLPHGLTPHNFRDVPFLSFNRKDDMQAEFVMRAFGLKRVALHHLFVPTRRPGARRHRRLGRGRGARACWCAARWPMAAWWTWRPAIRCRSSCTGIAGTSNPKCWMRCPRR